jgi:hypothetical protein
MGCGSSSTAAQQHKKEADEYAKRKKDGFKDQGLQKVMVSAKRHKKRLKHVDDPDTKRKQKIEDIKQNQRKNPTPTTAGPGNAATPAAVAGGGPALTEDTIQNQRNKLKHVKR